MAESLTSKVLEALETAGLLSGEQIEGVIVSASASGRSAGQLLIDQGLVTAADIENVLEDAFGTPRVDLSSYTPDESALNIVPADIALSYSVLPLFEIEGMLTVAVGQAVDVFLLDDLMSKVGAEIEVVLADPTSILAALAQYYDVPQATVPEAEEPAISAEDFFEAPFGEAVPIAAEAPAAVFESIAAEAPSAVFDSVAADPQGEVFAEVAQSIEEIVETAPSAEPSAIDLDVLAFADAGKVAVLVSDILAHAVGKGANRIQLLPYKGDFFLVYRVQGRLERVASAPLSLQGALVDGIKAFARLSSVHSSHPALGRVRANIGEKELIVTVSVVPTIAGQRLVISLSSGRSALRGLGELGMNEAETRALHAMVERGRGILLVCAPVAGGRSSTYYALLQHAAQAGKTVYSVERSIEHEIPSVAQVLVNPGAPIGAESYFAAGMRQDTDVMAIDPMQSVEDVHLAVEAAGLGKLVIATFSGGDIVSGVRRMLDLGAEPVSLAAALTLGVGQRLVRKNCPQCPVEVFAGSVTDVVPDLSSNRAMKGVGCAACLNTGFQGVTGIFEVLPFTEQVRVPIARALSADEILATAKSAGMRPMIAAGALRVSEGIVSPEELDRVMRFSNG